MATGCITQHSNRLLFAAAALAAAAGASWSAEVKLVGTFGDKAAILAIDGQAPRTVRVGQSLQGVRLVAVGRDRVTIEIGGERRVLLHGQTHSAAPSSSGPQTAVLSAGPGGHFVAEGQVNGALVRFLVDTGATTIALPGREAERLGIDYRKAPRGVTQTAAGPAPTYLVKLDTVRVGGIELAMVDAVVIEQGLPFALLGMSFLNRVEMKREGSTMTLTRRY